nr:hypothetical protein [Tanacetum cinerariifolium]
MFEAKASKECLDKGKAIKGNSNHGSKRKAKSDIAPTSDPKEAVCFYCNIKGHWKCSWRKYLKDLKDEKVKKGSHSGMFMIELHNTTTSNSWVLDTGCGTYIYTVLQGLKECRRLKHGELNLVMENRKITLVARIGKYELMLKSKVRIDLNNCCYSSEMTRNVISFHALFKDGYKFSFDNENEDILVYSNGCFMFKASPRKGTYNTVKCISHNGNVILNVGKMTKSSFTRSCEREESFGYLFYKPKDNVVFVDRRGVFPEREMISKEDSGSKIDLEEIQESANKEPIVNTDTQPEVVTTVKHDDISLPIRKTSGRVIKPPQFYYGFYIKEDKISDSILSEMDKPANYKEAMASPEAAKWKEAMKSKIQSMYDNQGIDEKKRLDHLKQDQKMLVVKIFSKIKKVFRERKKCEKIRAKRGKKKGLVTHDLEGYEFEVWSGKKKVNEVDFISQGVELVSRKLATMTKA